MSKSMIQAVRWVLTIPSAIAGYFFVFFLAAISYETAESFCPGSDLISEHCIAPYMNTFQDIAVVVFPTVAAILVVWLSYVVAPKYKMIVATSCYIVGSAIAVYFAVSTKLWVTLISVILAASIMVWYLARCSNKNA